MKRKDLLVGGIPLLAALAITTDKLTPQKFHSAASLTPITIGTTEAAEDYWPIFVHVAAEHGIHLITKNFAGYQLINTALVEKHIDVNLFQHILFLAQYITTSGNLLLPIGTTEIVPLTLYSHRYRSPHAIPDRAKIVIPNDTTNQGRALRLLQAANLIFLRNDRLNPTPADIDPRSKVSVISVDAAQTARNLRTSDAVVVNGNFASKARLNPNTAIFHDDPHSEYVVGYTNILVCRPEDVQRPEFTALLQARHDPRVLAAIAQSSNNTSIEVNMPPTQLRKVLNDIMRKLINHG